MISAPFRCDSRTANMKLVLMFLVAITSTPLFAQEISRITGFNVEQTSTSARIAVTLSNEVTVNNTGCFLDKLTFVSESATTFSPTFPGTCEFPDSGSGNIIIGTLHIVDFAAALEQLILISGPASSIIVTGESARKFLPDLQVTEISSPQAPATFQAHTVPPLLTSFDLDLAANKILLHFNSLVNAGTIRISRFIMLLGASPLSTVLSADLPTETNYVTTLCIPLTDSERALLLQCQNCSCFFSSDFISDYRGNFIIPILQSSPLQVSIVRLPDVPTSSVFMQLTLTYTIGCSALHNLSKDEVYILRPFENITRIGCFADNTADNSNIQPQISRENSFTGNINATIDAEYNWPLHTYLNVSGGLPPPLYGQYVCRSRIGFYSRNFIHDDNSIIELNNGSSVAVPLYSPLTISMYYGNTNISQYEIVLTPSEDRGGLTIPVYDVVNRFHVDIVYNFTRHADNGSYEIRIMEDGRIIARRAISIEVTTPIITAIPEVATILPDQTEIALLCLDNSIYLPIMWFSNDLVSATSISGSYREQVRSEIQSYRCSLQDPDRDIIVASVNIPVRNVPETLSVWRGNSFVNNNSVIVIINRLSDDLSLQCLEHVESISTNLTWYILPDGGSLVALSTTSSGKDAGNYTLSKSGNQANLTIVNSVSPFRGLLKCASSSGHFVTIVVAADDADTGLSSCREESDPIWNIVWNSTTIGQSDIQACSGNGVTRGVAVRQCNMNGVWSDMIDISQCASESFLNLQYMAESLVFELSDAYSPGGLEEVITALVNELIVITRPKFTSYFPLDLDTANEILQGLVTVLDERISTSIHTELVDVLNNLLNNSNTEGWLLLTEMNNGSQTFLNNSELFGVYLINSLLASTENAITVLKDNIAVGAAVRMNSSVDYIYPTDLRREAQVTIPAQLINEEQVVGVVTLIMENLELPAPILDSSSDQTRIASPILSSQLLITETNRTHKFRGTFSNQQAVVIEFLTERILRANNPVCVFWDTSVPGGRWSKVNTSRVEQVENGEFKQFKVRCLTNHLTAFAVAIDVDNSEFNFSLQVYIGCGVIIFCIVLSIFSLILSCAFDSLRRYSIVATLTHLSFVISLLCAYIAFIAGIEQALDNRVGCAAVAGFLHYFFTAAFSWLMCEGLLLIFFTRFSQNPGFFFIISIIGWGLPAIPTVISLGLLHETYGTTTQCWFYFDGQISNNVLLGFIIPKILVIAMIMITLMIGGYSNYKSGAGKKNRFIKINLSRILWLIWTSVLIFLILLSGSWVLALLLVNVYGLDSEVLGWLFMIATILLGVWIFIFSIAVMIINQKIDYDRLWSPQSPNSPPAEVDRGKGYEFMMSSEMDLSGKRTSRSSVIIAPPPMSANPGFGDGY